MGRSPTMRCLKSNICVTFGFFLVIIAVTLVVGIVHKEEAKVPTYKEIPWLQTSLLSQATVDLNATKESLKKYGRLTGRLIGMDTGAGLGNVLFELASLLGIANQLNRVPYLSANLPTIMNASFVCMVNRFPALLEQFELRFEEKNATVVPFEKEKCCVYSDINKLKDITTDTIYLDGFLYQSYKYFHYMRDTIRELITPSEEVQESVGKLLPKKVYASRIMCVHVRRGDFVTDKGYHNPSDANFTLAAIKHINNKYSSRTKVSIVVMGNDPSWERNITTDLQNVYILETTNTQDLSFSQQFCDDVLITAPSSTFGFWLGYLAKEGATVYYRDLKESGDQVIKEFEMTDFFPQSWVHLKFVDNEILEI